MIWKSYILEIYRANGFPSCWVKSQDYLKILSDQIHHTIAELFPEGNAIFHTVKIVSEWHKEHSSEVEDLFWPPLSRDLNIMKIYGVF